MVNCPNCGNEVEGDKNFCPKCGASVSQSSSTVSNNINKVNNKAPGKSSTLKKVGIVIVALVVIAVLAILAISMTTPDTTITVNDLKASNQGWGMYEITGTLIPDKDYDYLEMVVVFYDSNGAIIDKSPLAWNMNNVEEGQTIKITGTAVVSASESPAKAEVYFFDTPFGDDLDSAIYHETLDSSGSSSSSSSSSASTASSSGSMSILSGTISTGSDPSDKTYCKVYVGSEYAGESVKISVLYSRDGSNLNQGNIVPKTVDSNGYVSVPSAYAFDKYPDNAYITIYDSNGAPVDTKTVSLKVESGSQSF